MSLILRRSYQLVPKELTKNTKLPKVFRKKHEDPAKNIRAEIKQLKKHEKIFDEFGLMRKLTATLATGFAVSTVYSFYRAFLFEDLDAEVSKSDDLALRAASLKFAAAHFGWFIFFLPGPHCLFPQLCLKQWGVNLRSLKLKTPIRTKFILFSQISVCFISCILSVLSLDRPSRDWIETLPDDKKALAESLSIHPASQICDNLSTPYRVLHRGTVVFKHYDKPRGILDSKIASNILNEDQKDSVLKYISATRISFLNLLSGMTPGL